MGEKLNMVSFATGDFNRDGVDDLAVSYGLFTPYKIVDDKNNYVDGGIEKNTSSFKVFYGDRMNLFYSNVTLETPENLVRASVTARDLNGDSAPELVIGGNQESDIDQNDYANFTHFNSRYLAI